MVSRDGIARSTAQKIRQGQVSTVSRDVEHAILSIRKPYLTHGQKVPDWKMKRILRALLGEDYTKHAIARRAGLRPEQLSRAYQRVTVKTHLKMLRVWHAVMRTRRRGRSVRPQPRTRPD